MGRKKNTNQAVHKLNKTMTIPLHYGGTNVLITQPPMATANDKLGLSQTKKPFVQRSRPTFESRD
jgi:hypothetical protein